MKKTILLMAGFLLLNVNTSNAIDCPVHGSVSAELKRAAAVFSGKVIGREYRDVGSDAPAEDVGAKVLIVKIKVDRWWKGSGVGEVSMQTSMTWMPDGTIRRYGEDFNFREGESYLIYAFGPEDKLRTSDCTRSSRLAEAEDDLRELGEGRAPTEADAPESAPKEKPVGRRAGIKSLKFNGGAAAAA